MSKTNEQDFDLVARVSTCSIDPSLETEWKLIRSALLYADKVSICSPNVSFGVAVIEQTEDWSGIRQLIRGLPNQHLDALGKSGGELKDMINTIDAAKGNMSGQNRFQLAQLRERSVREFSNVVENVGINRKIAEAIRDLREKDLVEIDSHPDWNAAQCIAVSSLEEIDGWDESVGYYLEKLFRSIAKPSHLPLFDENSSRAIRTTLDTNNGDITPTQRSEAREARLAVELFDALPSLGKVDPTELVDIRRELHDPLIRFRGAVREYATELDNSAWEDGFPAEARALYRRTIRPAVNELEERISETSAIRAVFDNIVSEKSALTAAAGGLAQVGLGATNNIAPVFTGLPPETLIGLGIPAAAVAALESYKQWRDEGQELRKNKLFYYCSVRQQVS